MNTWPNNILIFLGSFFIGFLGSGAYILAVKVGFAGGNTEKERRFTYKNFENCTKNCFLYMFFGGFFAGVLQIVTPNTFVPFQSLITGITWPSVVSGLLSGKQAGPANQDTSVIHVSEEKKSKLIEQKEIFKELREIFNAKILKDQNLINIRRKEKK